MNIGKFVVKDTNNKELMRHDMNNFSLNSDNIYIQCEGGFMNQLPLQKGKLYVLEVEGIEDLRGTSFSVMYLDYVFNAGSSEWVDEKGEHHEGVVVLSNQLQFRLISA